MKRLIVRTSLTVMLVGMVAGVAQCGQDFHCGPSGNQEGEPCEEDSDCQCYYTCKSHVCTLPKLLKLGQACFMDKQCALGECVMDPEDEWSECQKGRCADGNEGSPCFSHYQCDGTLYCTEVDEFGQAYCSYEPYWDVIDDAAGTTCPNDSCDP